MRSRRAHALLLALALLTAACADDSATERGTGGVGAGGGGVVQCGEAGSGVAAGGQTGADAGAPDDCPPATTTTSAAPAPTGRPPTTTARPGAPATTRPPASASTTMPEASEPQPGSADVVPTPTDDGSQGPPGAFARTLLRPQPATGIVLERAAQPGATLAQGAVDRSAGVLSEVTAKPVDVRPVVTLATADTDWTADEIRQAADATARATQGSGGRAALRLLVLRGTFEGSQDVLGVAVRGDVLALFADNITGAATPLVSRQAIEDAVLLHELGHVLGLVDLARDTGRADKEHPGHSSNSASVMFWAVESSLVGQVLNGPPPRNFDAQDLADLRALRDGA